VRIFFQQTERLPLTITTTKNEQNSVVIILITIILSEENPLTRISPYSREATESSYTIHKQKRKIQRKKTRQNKTKKAGAEDEEEEEAKELLYLER
jgi:hypothetical protein